ncbi:ribonuclease P protein component [Sulfobacillus harzensis]|uniref:Ribonuclease P protein component n=1 Tax=Sulfobacillus harzensis TaxID=2729629 RepID=A0A7Y0L0B4_9FIRM|nr:ribonuclease P protein component [Sulfobacillus harzensis]NMP20918.1 ribonuclease P protein component [Sulfobacillus harzensis]
MQYQRLKKRAEFGQVFKRGRTYGDRYVVLFVLYPGRGPRPRVGFATQRTVGNAVRRNRVRRRLRALYSQYADDVKPCGDLIFLGKKSVLDARWTDLEQSMQRVLRQAGCLGSKG